MSNVDKQWNLSIPMHCKTERLLSEACLKMTVQLAWMVQEELETLLDESGHLRTLAFLYASKGMNSKALAIWRILARNYSSGLWKDPALESELLDTNAIVLSGKEVVAAEATKILEGSSDQDFVLQHLGWVCHYVFRVFSRRLKSCHGS